METIGFGFLFGVGILLACFAFCAVLGVLLLLALFVGYLKNKSRNGASKKESVDEITRIV